MERLKRYFTLQGRMNRKPYAIIFVSYFLLSIAVGAAFAGYTYYAYTHEYKNAYMEIVQQKVHNAISEEEYTHKIEELQKRFNPSEVVPFILAAFFLCYLPAIGMRFKDINLPAALALLMAIPLILRALTHAQIIPVLAPRYVTYIGLGFFAVQVALMFIPGTKGANRYGEDPR